MSTSEPALSFETLLDLLRGVAEDTRLRIVALLADADLSVSDLVDILGQSQPRVSRHLKLMLEAGVIERHREGAWAFFHLPAAGATRALMLSLVAALRPDDPVLRADRERLEVARRARAEAAQTYFARHAASWDRIRKLHAPDEAVDGAVRDALGNRPIGALLDLGTGTGRMLRLLAPLAGRSVGVDANHSMLAVARAELERAGLPQVELRQGDILAPPVARNGFDVVTIHHVLHFLDDPGRALREAATTLAPGGRLVVVDFAPHANESFRTEMAHRRLGFSHAQIAEWFEAAGLDVESARDLPPPGDRPDALTVSIWVGRDRRRVVDAPIPSVSPFDRQVA